MQNEMEIKIKIDSNKEEIDAIVKALTGIAPIAQSAGKAVNGLGQSISEVGKQSQRLAGAKKGFLGIGSGAKGAVGGVRSLTGAVGTLMTALMPVLTAAAVIGFTKKSLEAFGEFEKGMNSIFTLLPAKSAEAEKQMGEQVKGLVSKYGVEMKDATEAVYNAISAGVDEKDVFGFSEIAIKSATAGGAALSDAGAVLTTVKNNYRDSALEFGEISDLLFATVKKGVTTFPELSTSIGSILPSTAAAKVGFDQVSAAMATMTSTMGAGSTAKAGTAFRSMIDELNNSSKDTYKLFKQLNGGKDFKQFMESGGNIADAVKMLQGEADKTGVSLADMFGSIEAKKAANILGQNMSTLEGNLQEMQNSAGATDDAYKKMARGWDYTAKRLKGGLTVAMINFGEAIAPLVGLIGDGLIGAFNLINPALSVVGNAIADVFEPVNSLKEAWGFLNGKFEDDESKAKAFEGLSEGAKGVLAPLQNVKRVWENIKEGFTKGFGNVKERLLGAFSGLTEAWAGIWEPMQEKVKEVFSNLFGDVGSMDFGALFTDMFNGIAGAIEAITPVVSGLGSIFQAGFNIVMDVVGIAGEFVKTVLSSMGISANEAGSFFQTLGSIAGSVFSGLSTVISTAWGIIKPILEGLVKLVAELVGALAKVTFKGLEGGAKLLQGGINLLTGGRKKNALGTDNFSGGTTTISEQGKEMFSTPSGLVGISPNSRSEMFLPKGTEIISNKKTQRILNMAKNIYNNGGGTTQTVNNGGNVSVSVPINIENATQPQVDRISRIIPIIKELVENCLSDMESDRAYRMGAF